MADLNLPSHSISLAQRGVMIRKGKAYAPFEVLPKVVFASKAHGQRALARGLMIDFDGDLINMASEHLQTFARKGILCAHCGVEGRFFFKEQHSRDKGFVFNLYALDDQEQEVRMTRGHVVPRAQGGSNLLANWQTVCEPCRREPPSDEVNVLPHIMLTDQGLAIWMNVIHQSIQETSEKNRPRKAIPLRRERANLLDDGDLLIQAVFRGVHLQIQLPPDLWRWIHALPQSDEPQVMS